MNKKSNTGQVIIVFTEHPVLGPLLIPYIAERSDDETLQLIEQAFHASPEAIALMSETERQAIEIASHYTEKYLMSVYSREKTVSRFLRKLSEDPERVKNNIRPFIEKKMQEMLALIRYSNMPLYQKQTGNKQLYAHHAYHIHPDDVQIHFTFHADKETFYYQLDFRYQQQPLSVSELKPVIALTASPSAILLGMELYFFPHIESSRVLPFTKKDRISAPASLIDKYIDNIVIPIARYHEITLEGLQIREEKYTCQAILSVEETIYDEPVLELAFHYADKVFTPESSSEMNKIIYRQDNGDIISVERDAQTEMRKLQSLTEAGLQRINDSHLKLSPHAPERSLNEWIDKHRELLQESFVLTGNKGATVYCLDEIRVEQSYEDGPDWFEIHITVVIGKLRIPFSRFRNHILAEKREYILPDGQIILLPEEWFSKYGNLFALGTNTETGIRLKPTFVGAVKSALEDETLKINLSHADIPPIAPPPGIKAQLRSYQEKGFSWMVQLNNNNFGGCLADDMGLGKTLQTLTLLQYIYKPTAASDIVKEETEAAVDENEEENTPHASETETDGQYTLFSESSPTELLPETPIGEDSSEPISNKPASLIIVPTSLLHNWQREAKRFTSLAIAEYNSSTVFPKGQPELFFKHYHLIFASYGMMRNNIDILSSYTFEYVVLDESQNIKNSESLAFRSAIQLNSNHRITLTGTPIENSLKDLWAQFRFLQPDLLGEESLFQKQFIVPIRQGNTRAEYRLQQLIAPFILRRSKSEVAPELPSLTEEFIHCDMSEEQSEYYKQEKNSLRHILLQGSQVQDRLLRFNILNGILRLRQLSCHPRLIFHNYKGFSGKTEQIVETFDTLRSEGHKVLIFSSFVEHLEILAEIFRERGWKYALLTGTTNDRPAEIAHFTEQESVQAFLISLKAGGVGLNLTQADYVFIIDPWWNPAAEAQAIARAHRIGQNKQVIAYRFITQNSIEEKIIQLQEEKRKLAETFITDTDGLPRLSNEQWAELLIE